MLVAGLIVPVAGLISSPDGNAEYVPPRYPPVPVSVTFCRPASVHQGDPVYVIIAVGKTVTVKGKTTGAEVHPLASLYLTVTFRDPAVFHVTVAVLSVEPPPEVIVPPADTVQTYPVIPASVIYKLPVDPSQAGLGPFKVGVGRAFTFILYTVGLAEVQPFRSV